MKETFQISGVTPDTAGMNCTHSGKVWPSPVTRVLRAISRMPCLINSTMCHSVTDHSSRAPARTDLQPKAPLGHLWGSGTLGALWTLSQHRKTCPAAQMLAGLGMESPTLQCIDNPKKDKPHFVSKLTVFCSNVQVFQQKFCCHVHVLPRRNCPPSPKEVTSHLSFAKLSIYTTSLTKALHSHWLEVLVWFGLKTLHFTMILDNHSYRKILI